MRKKKINTFFLSVCLREIFPQPLLAPDITNPPPPPPNKSCSDNPALTAAIIIIIIIIIGVILNSHGQAEEKPLSEKSLPSSPSLTEEQMKKSNILMVSE